MLSKLWTKSEMFDDYAKIFIPIEILDSFQQISLGFYCSEFSGFLGWDSLIVSYSALEFIVTVAELDSFAHHSGSEELTSVWTQLAFQIRYQ